jgi:hypothetical protein
MPPKMKDCKDYTFKRLTIGDMFFYIRKEEFYELHVVVKSIENDVRTKYVCGHDPAFENTINYWGTDFQPDGKIIQFL